MVKKQVEKISHIIDGQEIFFYPKRHVYARVSEETGKTVYIPGVTSIINKNQDRLTQWAVNATLEEFKRTVPNTEIPEDAPYWWTASRRTSATIGSAIHKIIQDSAEKGEGEPVKMPIITKEDAGNVMSEVITHEGGGVSPDLFEECASAIAECISIVDTFFSTNEVISIPGGIETLVYYRDEHTEYCGRTDLFCLLNGKPAIIDIKTSKSVKINDFVQLAAYRKAQMRMKELTEKLNSFDGTHSEDNFGGKVDLCVLHIDYEKKTVSLNKINDVFGDGGYGYALYLFNLNYSIRNTEKDLLRRSGLSY